MTQIVLAKGISVNQPLPASFRPAAGGAELPVIVPTNGVLTFVAWGVGTGTWSAVVEIYPIQVDLIDGTKYVALDPIVFNLSNTAPSGSEAVQTAHGAYAVKISSTTGTVYLNAIVEG